MLHVSARMIVRLSLPLHMPLLSHAAGAPAVPSDPRHRSDLRLHEAPKQRHDMIYSWCGDKWQVNAPHMQCMSESVRSPMHTCRARASFHCHHLCAGFGFGVSILQCLRSHSHRYYDPVAVRGHSGENVTIISGVVHHQRFAGDLDGVLRQSSQHVQWNIEDASQHFYLNARPTCRFICSISKLCIHIYYISRYTYICMCI